MKRTALIVGVIASLAIGQVANALPVTSTYADVNRNWATWTAATNDSLDPFGSPDIASTSVTLDAGLLEKITFNLNSTNRDIRSGDLFIDAGADQTWDYVVRALGTTLNGTADVGLYALDPGVGLHDSEAYKMSWYYTSPPDHYRSGLPVGLLVAPSSGAMGQVSYFASSSEISFDFGTTSPLLFNERDFIIGYTVTCANDVVYQQVPVPEPGTMALFGAGLLGLVVYSKRRMTKSD